MRLEFRSFKMAYTGRRFKNVFAITQQQIDILQGEAVFTEFQYPQPALNATLPLYITLY